MDLTESLELITESLSTGKPARGPYSHKLAFELAAQANSSTLNRDGELTFNGEDTLGNIWRVVAVCTL